MSTKAIGGKMAAEMTKAILGLVQSAHRYTSNEIVAILSPDYTSTEIRRKLYYLRQHSHVAGNARKGYQISAKGLEKLQRLHVNTIEQTEPWDAVWRFVIYDIPEEHKLARDKVRRLIKRLGFVQVQQSVWAHALPCMEEFKQIQLAYGIQSHILLLEVPHTEQYNLLLQKIRQKYPEITC